MIVSNHHLTGFWFDSGIEACDDAEQGRASQFLSAALAALPSNQASEAGGAIHTHFDPLQLSTTLAGHIWLKDRLSWMKRTFPAFDDEPAMLTDPAKRRSPFPAFHWSRRYLIEGRRLSLEGVQVLIGHDFAVVHEFQGLLTKELQATLGVTGEGMFAEPPPDALFTAVFSQQSGLQSELTFDWAESEFTNGHCPGVDAPLRIALRGSARRYRGLLHVESHETTLFARARGHINASAYLTFLSTILVNHAKVEFEFDIANEVMETLNQDLTQPFLAKDMSRRATDSTGALEDYVHSGQNLERALYSFDQLTLTCQFNTEQFEHVSSRLFESDNLWTKTSRRRLRAYHASLLEAQKSMWKLFNAAQQQLGPRAESRIRDQIFISYSHRDSIWLEELKKRLHPYVQRFNNVGLDESMIWHDGLITPGDEWREKIKEALNRARAAIFLVSTDFLNSKFITDYEIPELLKAHKKEGVLLCWIHIKFSPYKQTVIDSFQFLHNPDKPLEEFRTRRNREWVKICDKIFEIIGPSSIPDFSGTKRNQNPSL